MDNTKQIEKRAVGVLRGHPEQLFLVGDISNGELNELIESIRKNGLQHPIEILRDGTVVAGHQRLRAVKSLNWIEVDVIVRHDLAQAGEGAIIAYLVEDNLHRRQMSPLAIARAYRNLKEIERDLDYNELRYDDRRDIRDRIAERLGGHYSGRTLDRYEQILDMPRAVQDVVISKALPLTLAVKITRLHEAQKQELAERIEAGETPKDVVEEYVRPSSNNSQNTPYAIHRRLMDLLNEAIEILPQHVETVAGTTANSEDKIDVLERSVGLLQRLIEAERECLEESYDDFDIDENFDDCNSPSAGHGDHG